MRPSFRLALASIVACLLLLTVIPEDASAIPYKIEGYLRDGQGVPIPLANITISGELYNPITQEYTPTTLYRETNAKGYYVIHVAGNEPGGFPLGSVITISYGSGRDMVSTTVTVDQGLGAWGNLTYKESTGLMDVLANPTVGILLVVIVASSIVIGYYIFKSAEEKTPEDGSKRVERRRRGK